MKCPKCAYLGFDTGERCRNCGYDFSLIPTAEPVADLALRTDDDSTRSTSWLDVMDHGLVEPAAAVAVTAPAAIARAMPQPSAAATALHFEPTLPPPSFRGEPALPLFGSSAVDSDEPMIKVPSPPRAPLAVRRTPDTPRLRAIPKSVERAPEPQLDLLDEPVAATALASPVRRPTQAAPQQLETSGAGRRVIAAAIDY